MKQPGIVGLFTACYDAMFMLRKGAEPQAVAYNGFAWYAGNDASVREATMPVVTLTADPTDLRLVTVAFTGVLSPVEEAEMVAQLHQVAQQLECVLLQNGAPLEVRPPRVPRAGMDDGGLLPGERAAQ